jgi:hypothetical protein
MALRLLKTGVLAGLRMSGRVVPGMVVLGTLASGMLAPGIAAAEDPPPGRNPAIVMGERLTFSVRYGVVKAGTAVLELKDEVRWGGRTTCQVVSTALSNSVFDKIYPVRDRVVSLMDPESLESLYFEKHLREGTYKADQSVRFDQEKGLATYQDGRQFQMAKGSLDVLAAFYRVRTMPLQVGQEFSLISHADRKNYPLRVTVIGREEVESILGPVSCLVVEPRLKSGAYFKNQGRLTIYLTDDDRRIPVLMRSKISVGSISVVLIKLERPDSGPTQRGRPDAPSQ